MPRDMEAPDLTGDTAVGHINNVRQILAMHLAETKVAEGTLATLIKDMISANERLRIASELMRRPAATLAASERKRATDVLDSVGMAIFNAANEHASAAENAGHNAPALGYVPDTSAYWSTLNKLIGVIAAAHPRKSWGGGT